MKQIILPGITLPEVPAASTALAEQAHMGIGSPNSPENTPDNWPDMAQMLGSLFVCELPSAPPLQNAAHDGCPGLSCSTSHDDSHDSSPSFPALSSTSPPAKGQSVLHDTSASTAHTAPAPRPIIVLGLGLQQPLPEHHRQRIQAAQVLAGGRALLERFPDAPAERIPLTGQLETALLALEQRYHAGQSILVLADGDPLFFGIGATLAKRLGQRAVRIFPAVSSLQEACARLALPWHTIACVSLHGRDTFQSLNVALMSNTGVCLLTDAKHSPDKIARHLLDRGVDWFDAHIFENLNSTEEQHHHLSLREVVGSVFGPVSTLLLLPSRAPRRPVLGIADNALATEGTLMTKGPVRAAALALLRISPAHTVWDVGAGSGAVSLEACALAHEGCVMSFERDAGRALCIKENRRRFGAANMEIFTGEAPQCLHQLPPPDRVFVGGGLNGDAGEDILMTIAAALPPGGRLVISCVLLGSLQLALTFLQQMQWPFDVTTIQASHSAPLAGDLRLNAVNPVFLVSTEKP